MLLLLETTAAPGTAFADATDLGFLLHKNPARAQEFALPFGTARTWYLHADAHKCSFALWLDIDAARLSRGPGSENQRRELFSLQPYVNDRPYAASSFLSVAIAQVLRDALADNSKERPQLAATPLRLSLRLPVVPSRGGGEMLQRLFAPLDYEISTRRLPLDSRMGWNESPYFDLSLRAEKTLSQVLEHVYVLLPVLDDDKHYWAGRSREAPAPRRRLARVSPPARPDRAALPQAAAWPGLASRRATSGRRTSRRRAGSSTEKDHVEHMEILARLAQAAPQVLVATPFRVVDLANEESVRGDRLVA
jgi:hypothetical protein